MTAGHDLRLHLVTDEALSLDRLLAVVAAAVAGGVTVVQLRAKSGSARRMLETLDALAGVTGSAKLIVNDRLDVALAALDAGIGVGGVHLGQDDVPPVTARRLLGPSALIGWTAHTPAHREAVRALPDGTLDYLGVGVIRATSTKADHPPELGVAGFAAFAAAAPLPCVAIGGVTADDAAALRAAGAAGVAVVAALCAADDPAAAARALLADTPVTAGAPR